LEEDVSFKEEPTWRARFDDDNDNDDDDDKNDGRSDDGDQFSDDAFD
jgi:hypothetical protein